MADLVKTKKLMEMNEWMIGRKYESIFKMSTESFLMVLGIGEQNERLCQAMEREGEKERERERERERKKEKERERMDVKRMSKNSFGFFECDNERDISNV